MGGKILLCTYMLSKTTVTIKCLLLLKLHTMFCNHIT